jgi:nucleotide-binding universal stress UspA family protein
VIQIIVIVVLVLLLVLAVAGLLAQYLSGRRRPQVTTARKRRILFPFLAYALSGRALDAALRLAIAEDATLVPVFLARVSLDLSLDTPLPRQSKVAMPLLEAIEQRASDAGIPVDCRIERGRTYRHALRQAILNERYDRIVIAAATKGSPGFDADDVAWLLDNAPGEIIVLRPTREEQLTDAPSQNGGPRERRVPATQS